MPVFLVDQAFADQLVKHCVRDAELLERTRIERPTKLRAQPFDCRLECGLELIDADFPVTDAGDERIGRVLVLRKRRAGKDASTDKSQDQQSEQHLDNNAARSRADRLQHDG